MQLNNDKRIHTPKGHNKTNQKLEIEAALSRKIPSKDWRGITRDIRNYFSIIKGQTKQHNYKIQLLPDIIKAFTFSPFYFFIIQIFYLHPSIYVVANHNFLATPLSEDVGFAPTFVVDSSYIIWNAIVKHTHLE